MSCGSNFALAVPLFDISAEGIEIQSSHSCYVLLAEVVADVGLGSTEKCCLFLNATLHYNRAKKIFPDCGADFSLSINR